MRIFIDIGHPAHVHYFKNFINLMEKNGHEFLIVARDKEITQQLLQSINIKYISRGKGGENIFEKIIYALKADFILYRLAKKFKPHFFLSFGSPYCAHISKLSGIKHIAVTDTEHAKLIILAFAPFTDIILTPAFYKKNFGGKQMRFNSFMELSYLIPKYFNPDIQVINNIQGGELKPYAILRFISWNASHDVGSKGLSSSDKMELIKILEKKYIIYISSESDLPIEFEKYKLIIPPDKLHDLLAFASIYVGEGGTTASECAALGIPNVLINPLAKVVGAHIALKEKYKLQYFFDSFIDAKETIIEIMSNDAIASDFKKNRKLMLDNTIDFTEFLISLFEEEYKKV